MQCAFGATACLGLGNYPCIRLLSFRPQPLRADHTRRLEMAGRLGPMDCSKYGGRPSASTAWGAPWAPWALMGRILARIRAPLGPLGPLGDLWTGATWAPGPLGPLGRLWPGATWAPWAPGPLGTLGTRARDPWDQGPGPGTIGPGPGPGTKGPGPVPGPRDQGPGPGTKGPGPRARARGGGLLFRPLY